MSMDEEHDSVSTTSLVREFLLRDGSPINYDPANQPRSQDLPRIDALNFAINILPRTTMIERKNVLEMCIRDRRWESAETTVRCTGRTECSGLGTPARSMSFR